MFCFFLDTSSCLILFANNKTDIIIVNLHKQTDSFLSNYTSTSASWISTKHNVTLFLCW
jgi:hypothetical protein